MKKKLVAFACLTVACVAFARASEEVPLSEFESLRRLDSLGEKAPAHVAVVRDAFQTINENALKQVVTGQNPSTN